MKKVLFIFALLISLTSRTSAQISRGAEPSSFHASVENSATVDTNSQTKKFKPAPIDKILDKNLYPNSYTYREYKSAIIKSFTLKPRYLKTLLQKEFDTINQETQYIIATKNSFHSASTPYKFANYQLLTQISQEITKRNKQYKKLKKSLQQLMTNLPPNQNIYIIESHSGIFMEKNQDYDKKTPLVVFSPRKFFISIFDSKFKHLLTYKRMHVNILKKRKIYAPTSSNSSIKQIYQRLFDEYLDDLTRIGKGLDINNPTLLRQLGEMQNKTLVLELK